MLFMLMVGCQDLLNFREENAKANANDFLKELGMEATGIACSSNDSDGDWYVSCTVLLTDGQRWPLECGVVDQLGCRERSLVNVIGRQADQ